MPIFLDTRGHSTLAIAICARCKVKYPRDQLTSDPNFPGLLCCPDGCLDVLDPWRLPPPPADRITVDQPRPDRTLTAQSPIRIYTNQIDGITQIQPTVAWAPVTFFQKGASVVPLNTNSPNVTLPQYEFVALTNGISASTAPAWPTNAGVELPDGAVTWLCNGIYLGDGIAGGSVSSLLPVPSSQ